MTSADSKPAGTEEVGRVVRSSEETRAWRASTAFLLLRGLRPRQWTKNLLVFMAPAAAGVLGHWHVTVRVIGAFAVFCLVASGTYLVNDVVDAAADRHHPLKRHRPVASGALQPALAVGTGLALVALAIAGALVIGPWGFALIIIAYVAVNAAYTVRLKEEPVIELAVVASCYVLRAVAGGVVAHVPLSNWFLLFTSFAALFVVTGKRYAEHARLGHDRGVHRPVLDEYTDSFLRSTLILSATVTVASYCLWAFDRTGLLSHAGHHVVWVELTVIPAVLAVLHILRLLDAGKGGEPEHLALHDHVLQGYALGWLALMAIGLYA
ncbi:MAG TPA: decaprenyl-phosphate phosphoribosyltransferase [Acidimicrobiales bacterium]|nr:decaprenyl-phosphate phosphoribosyltransferase [Acidimicrobiales bacterium]